MIFGLYCDKFNDYKSIIKKMKKGGFDILIVPLHSIFELNNISMHFLEKSLGLNSKRIEDLYNYYFYQECEVFKKDKEIASILNIKLTQNENFNIWLISFLLLNMKNVYKYAKYKNVHIAIEISSNYKIYKFLNSYCDYLFYKNKNILINFKGEVIKYVDTKNQNIYKKENIVNVVSKEYFDSLNDFSLQEYYLASLK